MRREVLDRDIRAGKEEALMAVVSPTDQIRRLTVGPVHLQDLRISIGFAHHMALHDESVSDTRIHVQRPFADVHSCPQTSRTAPRAASAIGPDWSRALSDGPFHPKRWTVREERTQGGRQGCLIDRVVKRRCVCNAMSPLSEKRQEI